MSTHLHPPGTPPPYARDVFLVDGCPRCEEYVEELGLPFDEDRFRAFWAKMVAVEYDSREGYASGLDKQLGRRLYYLSLCLQRAFGLDPRTLARNGLEGGRMDIVINGWRVTHDGSTWWALRDGDEPYAGASYLEAAGWASANQLPSR